MLTVLQVGVAAHERQSSTPRCLAALPRRCEHAAGINGELMHAYCCLKLRTEYILAESLVGWDEAQLMSVTRGQRQRLLGSFDQVRPVLHGNNMQSIQLKT